MRPIHSLRGEHARAIVGRVRLSVETPKSSERAHVRYSPRALKFSSVSACQCT